MLFDDWPQLGRAALLTVLVYLAMLLVIRAAGSRAISKMSAHDMVVTVALGSIIATIPLQSSVTLARGVVILAMFLALQRALKYMNRRWPVASAVIRGNPTLVVYDGRILDDRARALHLTEADVRAAIRGAGLVSLDQAHAVVLELDGSWSVIRHADAKDHSALEGLDVPVAGRG